MFKQPESDLTKWESKLLWAEDMVKRHCIKNPEGGRDRAPPAVRQTSCSMFNWMLVEAQEKVQKLRGKNGEIEKEEAGSRGVKRSFSSEGTSRKKKFK